ncbi:MAG TPA: hypothetical protein VG370_23010 [Chloroflexota bacterium]|nr:hypothetical protein [Chloroflexota bacterium]
MRDRDDSHRHLIDKLGLEPGQRVSVVGVADGPFWRQLRERTDDVSDGDPRPDSDAIVYAAMEPADLARLAELPGRIKPNGMIWVVSPKGRPDFRDTDVMRGGLAVGLVDVKVASFSERLTATEFVIPLAKRPTR